MTKLPVLTSFRHKMALVLRIGRGCPSPAELKVDPLQRSGTYIRWLAYLIRQS